MKTKLKYFIGADVHQSTTTVCVLDANGERCDLRTLPTTELALRTYLKGFASPKGLILEEGALAQWLFLVLRADVDELFVCDPYQNHLLKKGAKNDSIDARRLADLYRAQMVSPVFHSDDGRMELRKLTSAYRETVKAIVRTGHQQEALKRRVGREEKNLSALDRKILALHKERLEIDLAHKDLLVAEVSRASRRYPEMRILKSIPGIGPIGAIKLVATVVDPMRFANKHKFWSYCSLVRHNRNSGGQSYGKAKARGHVELKSVFKTAAITSLQGKGPMKNYYEMLRQKGLDDFDARHAVARKIAAIVLACWKNKTYFDAKYLKAKGEDFQTITS